VCPSTYERHLKAGCTGSRRTCFYEISNSGVLTGRRGLAAIQCGYSASSQEFNGVANSRLTVGSKPNSAVRMDL
jgi:hypothetical protein